MKNGKWKGILFEPVANIPVNKDDFEAAVAADGSPRTDEWFLRIQNRRLLARQGANSLEKYFYALWNDSWRKIG